MMEQHSEDWFKARVGKVTASRIVDVMAKTKTGYSASRHNYLAQLVAERMTGQRQDSFSNAAMQWGTDTEPMARATYEIDLQTFVAETGFHDHPSIAWTGASPDGLIGKSGLIEIKCPNTATHIDYLLNQQVPQKYLYQMMWQMDCTSREWCDFVSYDPRMPEKHQMLVRRIKRDDSLIQEVRDEVLGFLNLVQATVDKLDQLQDVSIS